MTKIIITGSAGFIGYSLSLKLLNLGYEIIGIDNHNNYYSPELKNARVSILTKYSNYEHFKMVINYRGRASFHMNVPKEWKTEGLAGLF